MKSSFLFVITPVPNLAEEAIPDLELAMRRDLGDIPFVSRNVNGHTHLFFRELLEDGRPRFLWVIQLRLVDPGSSSVLNLISDARKKALQLLNKHVTISHPIKLDDF